MKQPNIKIFGEIHKVKVIRFDDDGFIEKIVYEISKHNHRTVFRGKEITNKSLTGKRKIQEPTKHPYFDFSFAPELESLLC